jgi:uncharacterized membrane protein
VTRHGAYLFLIWNAALAWIPFALSKGIVKRYVHRGSIDRIQAGLCILWLLFLPNTFYIVTDFVHLQVSHSLLVWFEILLIASFVWLGMLYGFVSLRAMHLLADELWGRRLGWAFASGSIILSAVGIFLGRVPRFNSWDILTAPGGLINYAVVGLSDPFAHLPFLSFVGVLATFLGIIYFTVFGSESSH